jgi:hypothetical protein
MSAKMTAMTTVSSDGTKLTNDDKHSSQRKTVPGFLLAVTVATVMLKFSERRCE